MSGRVDKDVEEEKHNQYDEGTDVFAQRTLIGRSTSPNCLTIGWGLHQLEWFRMWCLMGFRRGLLMGGRAVFIGRH